MSASNIPDDESQSPSAIRRAEEVCDEFEAALKAGQTPDPQDFLEQVAGPHRLPLLIELRELLRAYRPKCAAESAPPEPETLDAPPSVDPEESDDAPFPEQFGKYRILGKLGEGAMGIVYRAHHPVLNQDVALKTIRPQNLLRWGETARILAEARHVAKLNHPHIVAIHDADEEAGWPYFTMALVDGGTLHSRLSEFAFGTRVKNETGQPGRLTLLGWSRKQRLARREKILTLMEKVCRAVHAAHANEPTIIHRDLKPGNILLDRDEPRVSDFGLAKSPSVHDAEQISDEGTPPYMAPEQHRGEAKNIRATSDIWAIGVILYELFTGRRPFRGESRSELKDAVLNTEPPNPRTLNHHIDLDLEAVILKCLAKDASKRYQTAAELADELVRCRSGIPVLIRPISRSERVWRWARRNPALASVSMLAVIGTIGFFLFVNFDKSRLAHQEKLKAATDAQKKGLALCEQGEAGQGLLWLARGLEIAPANATELKQAIREKMADCFPMIAQLNEIIEESGRVLAVTFSPDGRFFLTGNADGKARLYDAKTLEVLKNLPHPERVLAVAFCGAGKRVLTGCYDEHARLWRLDSNDDLPQVTVHHGGYVSAVAFGHDGNSFFSGSSHGTAIIWSAVSGHAQGSMQPPNDAYQVWALATNSDGRRLAIGYGVGGGGIGEARIWDPATQKSIGAPLAHTGNVWAVAFSPDDNSVVIGTQGEAQHWILKNNDGPIHLRLSINKSVRCVAFDRLGKTIASGDDDGWVRLWDVETGKEICAPLHHPNEVRGVAFSPNSVKKLILSGCEDGGLRIWEWPAKPFDQQDNVVLATQVLTGMTLDQDGAAHCLSSHEWRRKRQLFNEVTKRPTQ